jgi:glycosyltransferase involved in cell wall biosynthesis
MSRVSICTSVLNQSEYLKRMIESVRAQTFTDWDLFIVDDGSTEDIAAVVNAFDDDRILVHRFDENQGIPHGLNYAMAHSGGEYLQPLSADEWISPDKLAVQVEYLDSHPDIGCVWGLPGKSDMGMGERPTWEQFALKAHNRSS